MRDVSRRKPLKVLQGADAFFARYHASLLILEGAAQGRELEIQGDRLRLGCSPAADLTFNDAGMSGLHAEIQVEDHVEIRSLGDGDIRVNGAEVRAAKLEHGDCIEIGEHVLELVLEERDPPTRIMSFPGE